MVSVQVSPRTVLSAISERPGEALPVLDLGGTPIGEPGQILLLKVATSKGIVLFEATVEGIRDKVAQVRATAIPKRIRAWLRTVS